MASMGRVESVIQLLISIIGFGMQTEAIRTIAFAPDWKAKLGEFQAARTMMSLVLVPGVMLIFFDWTYICFLLAPILALSCDYALYARGLPVVGATIALIRVAVPLAVTMAISYVRFPFVPEAYLVASFLTFLFTNMIISARLNIPFWWKPTLQSFKGYLVTIPIGIINLCLFFYGLGILILAQFLVADKETALAYMALKLYVVYKGGIRVIHQGFLSQMKDNLVCLRVDQVAILLALLVLASAIIFPNAFIGLFFGSQFAEEHVLFILLGASALIYSLFSSMNTRALLEKKDMMFLYLSIASVLLSSGFLIVASRFSGGADVILVSLLIGEGVIAVGLGRFMNTFSEIRMRVVFLLFCLPALIIPFAAKALFSDSPAIYLASFTVMALVLFGLNYKKFHSII